MKVFAKLLPGMAAILVLTACNATAGSPTAQGLSVEAEAATIVAATMNAYTAQAPQATPTVPPVLFTPPPAGAASLFINVDNASCRSGPGSDFQVIATFPAGTTVPLVGQDTPDSYWIVKDPGSNKECWVSVMDSTPSGDYQALPRVTPQPINVAVSGKPNKVNYGFFCDNSSLTVQLSWSAPTGQVNGYRIYRQGSQIADVPATQTDYTEKVPFKYGSRTDYEIAAYNEAGVGPQAAWNFSCP